MEYRVTILEGQIELLKKQREWDKDEFKREIEGSRRQVYFTLLNCLAWAFIVLMWIAIFVYLAH